MTVESNATQILWYGSGFKFLNKFSETGYKVLYLAIWLVSFLWVVHCIVLYPLYHQSCKTSEGCVRKQTGLRLSTTHM